MRLLRVAITTALVFTFLLSGAYAWEKTSTWGFPRDSPRLDRRFPPPCVFPPITNPCAAPCRGPWIQAQAVPCGYDAACPALKLPCHGFSYGANPYPLFYGTRTPVEAQFRNTQNGG